MLFWILCNLVILLDLRCQRNDEVGFGILEVEWSSFGYLCGFCLSWCYLWEVNFWRGAATLEARVKWVWGALRGNLLSF